MQTQANAIFNASTLLTASVARSAKKLIHIAGVALAMVLTLGLAVVVSGHPTDHVVSAPSHINSASQSALLMQASAASVQGSPGQQSPVQSLPVEQTVATQIKGQPELMHDAPVVETKTLVSHTRVMRMVVTAYCPCSKCCGQNANGITASGKLVNYNAGRFVAADASLPFGTKILIPGYSAASVEVLDRGGAIRGNRIDVFFPTHQQALQWGRQTLDVTIAE